MPDNVCLFNLYYIFPIFESGFVRCDQNYRQTMHSSILWETESDVVCNGTKKNAMLFQNFPFSQEYQIVDKRILLTTNQICTMLFF